MMASGGEHMRARFEGSLCFAEVCFPGETAPSPFDLTPIIPVSPGKHFTPLPFPGILARIRNQP